MLLTSGCVCLFIFCLFGVLRRFQHCTGHITTGSWKGRGNQYIEFARVTSGCVIWCCCNPIKLCQRCGARASGVNRPINIEN